MIKSIIPMLPMDFYHIIHKIPNGLLTTNITKYVPTVNQ